MGVRIEGDKLIRELWITEVAFWRDALGRANAAVSTEAGTFHFEGRRAEELEQHPRRARLRGEGRAERDA